MNEKDAKYARRVAEALTVGKSREVYRLVYKRTKKKIKRGEMKRGQRQVDLDEKIPVSPT